ncbi:MAG: T9SS type A sorting domain-containing protein, partial [Flavobacteriales bacterium]|nr:T9SS type A sorting domain-containing protein [Flavobacteriales bacterium]
DPPSCDTGTAGFADVWYTFNSGASTTVLIDFEHGTMTDWGISVNSACEGTEVACIVQPASLVDVVVQPGTDYWIRVFSNLQFGVGGAFEICLTGITQDCDAGVLSTAAAGTEPIVVCQDLQADVLDFITSSTSTENYSFILTNDNDVIVSTITGASVDFNSAPLGDYRVWGVSYNGILLGTDLGSDLSGVASSGGCIDVSDAFISVSVEICSGVGEQAIGGWNVYPNPSNGDITVLNELTDGLVRLELFDLAGRTIWQEQWQSVKAASHPVSLGGRLASGTYSLRLTSSDGRSDQRVIIR